MICHVLVCNLCVDADHASSLQPNPIIWCNYGVWKVSTFISSLRGPEVEHEENVSHLKRKRFRVATFTEPLTLVSLYLLLRNAWNNTSRFPRLHAPLDVLKALLGLLNLVIDNHEVVLGLFTPASQLRKKMEKMKKRPKKCHLPWLYRKLVGHNYLPYRRQEKRQEKPIKALENAAILVFERSLWRKWERTTSWSGWRSTSASWTPSRWPPGGSVRGERANLTRLLIGCIEAKFCKKMCVGKLLTRSTRFTCFCTAQSSIF